MIINKDINPIRNIYYLGGRLIDILQNHDKGLLIYDAYEAMIEKVDISMNMFTLTLDWLYLIDVITIEDGRIYKCF